MHESGGAPEPTQRRAIADIHFRPVLLHDAGCDVCIRFGSVSEGVELGGCVMTTVGCGDVTCAESRIPANSITPAPKHPAMARRFIVLTSLLRRRRRRRCTVVRSGTSDADVSGSGGMVWIVLSARCGSAEHADTASTETTPSAITTDFMIVSFRGWLDE